MMKTMYFTATTSTSSHTINERMPNTFSGVGEIVCSLDMKHCCSA